MEINENQQNIYDGLKSIGEEISSFYMDALRILHNETLQSKSYLLAHVAREIDGGLRDILAPTSEKEELLKVSSLKDRGNVVSILVSLDLPIDDNFAKQYIGVATKFHKYAHRRGATKPPREAKEVIQLWFDYEIILLKLLGSFINQLKQIERIVRFEKPTKQILAALRNIFKDEQKERHFYISLKKVSWLKPLHNNGFFSPEYILDEALWNQAEYLEFISLEIKKGNVDDKNSKVLIKIVLEICNYSKNIKKLENYRIWYFLLDILTNLPKDYVTDKIVDYIPDFFNTKYENNLQSESIFKLIYSFFDKEEITNKDKRKIEKLVKLVFEISDKQIFRDRSSYETGKYSPIIRAYRLKQACENPVFYSGVSKYCSNKIIYSIADNLLIYLKAEYISEFWIKSIFHIDEVDKNSYSIETIYSIFLKISCVEISKQSKKRIREIISAFLSDAYNHKHFIKLSLFLFAKTWKNSKQLFLDFIKNNDENMLFSNNFWADDLYFLLEEIADSLTEREASIIERIIENGSQDKDYYDKSKYLDDYRLLWYSALSTNLLFEKKFELLSSRLSKDKKEIRPREQRNVTFGSTSPISNKELKTISVSNLVGILKTFDPERTFREPCVEGLATNLNTFIKESPEVFYNNCNLFLQTPYRHISEICSALTESWKNDSEINWKNILNFIYKYIKQTDFATNHLQLKNASYKHDHLDVVKSFCRLLSAGMRRDEQAFDAKLLPIAEKIIFVFLDKYVCNELEDKAKGKLGSAMHAINSTSGVIIGTLFDLSLRKARLLSNSLEDKSPKWEDKEKEAYEKLIEKNIQEFYMYLGWHRNQFYFLDYTWTSNQLQSIPSKDNQTIKSYFGGHLIEYPNSKFEYETFKDVYLKAIKEDWKVEDSTMRTDPLEVHATIFYIFDYEDLREGEILTYILNQKNIQKIRSIIHSLSFKYDQYLKNQDADGKSQFKKKIFKIWNRTLEILEDSTDLESKDMPTLFYLIKYIEELNEENYELIINTSKYARHGRDFDELIKNLNRLKLQGDVVESSIYACDIFMESVFQDFYYASIMQKEIIEFTESMYLIENEKLTNYSNKICNEFAKNGQYFLRNLYEKYNS